MQSAEPEVRSLAQLCEVRAVTHGESTAVDDGAIRLTYAELAGRATAVADRLRGLGIGRGDRVVVQGRNRAAWVVAAFGVLAAGATLAPVGHGTLPAERDRLLASLGPKAVLCELPGDGVGGDVPTLGFDELMAWAPRSPIGPLGAADEDGTALVLASSGTTGAVKLVPMSHHQLLRLYGDVATVLGVTRDDRLLGVVPLSHSFGLNGLLLVATLAGAAVRLCPSYDRERVAALVRDEGLSVVAGPPTVFHDLERYDDGRGLGPAARLAVVGGQTVVLGELLRVARRLGLRELAVGYGMTEACGTVALGVLPIGSHEQPEDEPPAGLVPMPGVDVRIGAPGSASPPSAPGPILVRGYNLARPYADAPDLSPGGWYDTGDVGTLDADGRLTVVGRSSDRVIVSGFNVYPRDVERVLAAHPGVAQVAVLGVPDPRRGQRLVACVVPRRPDVEPEALRAFARGRISAYKVPTDILLLPDLPLTATGKISRSSLREVISRRIDT